MLGAIRLACEFEGLSLPDSPDPTKLAELREEFAQWNWLLDDPLFELTTLTIRASPNNESDLEPANKQPYWEKQWLKVKQYEPTGELRLLLARGDLLRFWPQAWADIIFKTDIPRSAFKESAQELPEAFHALARSLVAQLDFVAANEDFSGPSPTLRRKLVDRLLTDWDQQVLGLGDFFFRLVKRAGTRYVANKRNRFNEAAAFPIGDVLLYQARGGEI